MGRIKSELKKFHVWRIKHISNQHFLFLLSIVIGVAGGLVAATIKNTVHFIRHLFTSGFALDYGNYLYIIYPGIGIFLAIVFMKYILRKNVENDGIPMVLYAISKKAGFMKPHNMFSSIITSSFTVGFGGSVGLEGPTIATGASIGSNVARVLGLTYKDTVMLVGAASAASLAAIFKAPITGIIFVLEIMMLDMNLTFLMTLLLSSVTGVLTSYFFLGKDVLYPVTIHFQLQYKLLPYFFILSIITAIFSLYYYKVYVFINKVFGNINKWYWRYSIGAIGLGVLILLFPALYGEGYESMNAALNGDFMHVFEKTFYYSLHNDFRVIFLVFLFLVLLKVVAMTLTFAAGGVGGVFAPTLFIGSHIGLLFALLSNHYLGTHLSLTIFALAGMAGMISGVLHGPLTGMFLIAEITSSYSMFMPLMLVSVISFFIVRLFNKYSIYTYQLASRGGLITHDKDKSVLRMLEIDKLLETNFTTVKKEETLRDLIKKIEVSSRNLFPVVDDNGNLEGLVLLDDIRKLMFNPEYYDKIHVKDVMYLLKDHEIVDVTKDDMEEVLSKFTKTGHYNLPVVEKGKYLGFLSRANVLTSYQKLISLFSSE